MLRIIPTYAGLLGLLFIVLSARVIGARRQAGIAIGTGSERGLERRMRAHGNFAEYVPFAVVLLAFFELQGAAHLLLHMLCIALVLGRFLHAVGISREPEDLRLRVAGMVLTFAVIGITAAGLIGLFLMRLLGS